MQDEITIIIKETQCQNKIFEEFKINNVSDFSNIDHK